MLKRKSSFKKLCTCVLCLIMAVTISQVPAIPGFAAGANLVQNGEFSVDSAGWSFWMGEGADTSSAVRNGEYKEYIRTVANSWYSTQLRSNAFSVSSGKTYKLTFKARSSVNRTIRVVVENKQTYAKYFDVNVNTTGTMQTFTYQFAMNTNDSSATVLFGTGNVNGSLPVHEVYFDGVILQDVSGDTTQTVAKPAEVPDDIWRYAYNVDKKFGKNGDFALLLCAVIKKESNFGAGLAGSPSAGDGLMQVEPNTRNAYASKFISTYGRTYNNDSQQDQVCMGGLIIKEYISTYGNVYDALLHYNGGPNWYPGCVDSYGRPILANLYADAVYATYKSYGGKG